MYSLYNARIERSRTHIARAKYTSQYGLNDYLFCQLVFNICVDLVERD
jgi:hypothetical protein